MTFYTVLKYVLIALFTGILTVGYFALPDNAATDTARPETQQPQSKFNF